jgi:hypothetical protein
MSVGRILANVRIQNRDFGECGIAERIGNIGRTVGVLGSGSKGVQIGAKYGLRVGIQKILLKGTGVGPLNSNRDGLDDLFCGTGRSVDIAGVKRKDGGWRLFDDSGGLLGLESDGGCDGAELF